MGRGGEVLPSRDSTRIVISDTAKIDIFILSSKLFLTFFLLERQNTKSFCNFAVAISSEQL